MLGLVLLGHVQHIRSLACPCVRDEHVSASKAGMSVVVRHVVVQIEERALCILGFRSDEDLEQVLQCHGLGIDQRAIAFFSCRSDTLLGLVDDTTQESDIAAHGDWL